MSTSPISKFKIRTIRNNVLNKTMTRIALSKKVGVSPSVIDKYSKAFLLQAETHPGQALNVNFFPPIPKRVRPTSPKLVEMNAALPSLIAALTVSKASVPALYASYRKMCPNGYAYEPFRKRFTAWHKASNICVFAHKMVIDITTEDRKVLNQWLAGNDLLAWRQATVITGSYEGEPLRKIAAKLQLSYPTMLAFVAKYNAGGLPGPKRKYGGANAHWVTRVKKRKRT